MKFSLAPRAFIFLVQLAAAQTHSTCNPTLQSCAADPALGGSSQVDFSSGESSEYTGTGNGISYNSAGAQLTVSKQGDNPTLTSTWYLMFGKVDFVFKSAPGVGMVSSAILLSDDLDEIDWELLGADASQAQTNYYGKGFTGTYNRGGFASIPTSQSDFNTYSIDWTSEQITWSINGAVVRTLTYAEAAGQYPQSPMQVKVGSWAGGDSSNPQGTIEWAGGPIDYASGPYAMQVKSISATDYSTGTEYKYDGTSGTWQSIVAVGGSVGSGGSAGPSPTSSGGTHQHTSAYVTPSVYPWVPASSGTTSAGPPASSYLSTGGYQLSGASSKTHSTKSPAPSSPVSSSAAGCDAFTANSHRANGAETTPSCTSPYQYTAGATTLTTLPASQTATGTSPVVSSTLPPFSPNAAAPSMSPSHTGIVMAMTACLTTGLLAFFL